jgi:hypothetical protein
MRIVIHTALLVSAAALLVAQENTELGFLRALGSGETVKDAPYSAEAVTETTQLLADGNRIVSRSTSKQYRDSEGRERREIALGGQQTVLITDPVAGVSYSLLPDSRTAEKMPLPRIQVLSSGAESSSWVRSTQVRMEAFNGASALALGGPEVPVINDRQVVARAPGDADPQTENLGTSLIEGVLAEGKRTHMVIPPGQAGNDKPIEVAAETWYSPDLKMTIVTRNFDPRLGETVFKLTNISRAEPARTLFEVPAGYTVNEGPRAVPGQQIQVIQRELH